MGENRYSSVALVAAKSKEAQRAVKRLRKDYETVDPENADVIVALGGDGFMLRSIHEFMDLGIPIFGMNRGSVGFLMNKYVAKGLIERLERSQAYRLAPLHMTARCSDGSEHQALAINEVSLFRETAQAAHIQVAVDGRVRLDELICDGVLVSTPAGSTAYNMSVYGPILPLGSRLLALTAISAYRPRRWRGALLPREATVTFTIKKGQNRPVGATADFTEVRDVVEVSVREKRDLGPTLLFDPEHNLEERIISEQFVI